MDGFFVVKNIFFLFLVSRLREETEMSIFLSQPVFKLTKAIFKKQCYLTSKQANKKNLFT